MHPPPFPHHLVSRERQIRHDALLGHAFAARLRMRVPHEHGAYYVETNAEGYRESHDLASPPPGFRVLCLGDSYAAGDGVDNHERFSALLAARLGVVVTNLAVPGYGPDQNLLQVERTALPPRDLIVWCIAVHTLDRIQSGSRITIDRQGRMWTVPRPCFAWTERGTLELRNVPVPETKVALEEDVPAQIRSPWIARTAAIVGRARARLARALGPLLKPEPDPGYEDRESPEWRLLAAIVRRFHAAARGVPIVIVPLPTARYVRESLTAHFSQRFRELEDREGGLHVLDVLEGLRRCGKQEIERFHYRLDGHFTVSGHEAVAASLASAILERGLVPEPASVVPPPPPRRSARAAFTLHVGWSLGDGFARLGTGGTQVSEHHEASLTGHPIRPGVLPLSAVHACLEDAGVAGPELREIVLWSPAAPERLASADLAGARAFPWASGHVRWFGAAERDLRHFLAYEGPLCHACVDTGSPPMDEVATMAVPAAPDVEMRWIQERLARIPQNLTGSRIERRLRALGRTWEVATREAREAVLPTTAPLRRGRVAARLMRQGRV